MLKQIAVALNGRKYGEETTKEIQKFAKEHGIVIVYGESDDLMEFDGYWYDEFGCYDGGTAHVTPNGLLSSPDCCVNPDKCTYIEKVKSECATITAVWQAEQPYGIVIPWTYETDIPHENFLIYEDGKPYCRGIVFYAKDAVKRKEAEA